MIIVIFFGGITLKGLSHEIFTVIFWLEWIYIGQKGNRFWFLNFKDVSSILDSTVILSIDAFHTKPSRRFATEYAVLQFFYILGLRFSEKLCKECQYFSEILRISEND